MEPIELRAKGWTATETLPYDALDVHAWHRRARAAYAAPPSVVRAYLPLAARPFATQCPAPEAEAEGVLALGDLGLGLALDERRTAVVSVEAAALYELVQAPGERAALPAPLAALQATWAAGACLLMACEATGWRGLFAEHRVWTALLGGGKTPYPLPAIRGWYPPAVLADLRACVGEARLARLARLVARHGFDGAPDLLLYAPGRLRLVEVKSATDRVTDAQRAMLAALARHADVRICCPSSARKRMPTVTPHSSDSEESA